MTRQASGIFKQDANITRCTAHLSAYNSAPCNCEFAGTPKCCTSHHLCQAVVHLLALVLLVLLELVHGPEGCTARQQLCVGVPSHMPDKDWLRQETEDRTGTCKCGADVRGAQQIHRSR